MDFLDSDAGSSPPASDEESGAEAGNESGDRDLTRESVDVGERINLRDFAGRCVGDNVSWKGSAALRLVALQSARSAGDRCEWGRFWGNGFRELGASVGVIAETGLWEEAAVAAAVRGMACAGYTAIAHGVPPGRGAESGYELSLANGVLLAVRDGYPGGWETVDRDGAGRGLAACITSAEGNALRLVGVYGVSGASLPGFDRSQQRLDAERRLLEFVRAQVELSSLQGWTLVVMGDLNSVVDPALDTWGGTHIARTECLAQTLVQHGLEDTFRCRRPELLGFTYYGPAGAASRLDGIWIWRPPGLQTLLLNAAVMWGWVRRADHGCWARDWSSGGGGCGWLR